MNHTRPQPVTSDKSYFSFVGTPESLLEDYQQVRDHSKKLCQPLRVEDYVVQSMDDASPTKWHLAHTSWFFETFVLARFCSNYRSSHPQYSFLFNSYYVQAGDRYPRPLRGLVTRPTVAEVFEYRDDIDQEMVKLIEQASQDIWEALAPIIEIGIHHEQQHQELILTDIKHVLSFNPLYPTYVEQAPTLDRSVAETKWMSFQEGLYRIGHDGKGFCYDNEMPLHQYFLEPFQLANRLVTNGEYLEFIEDGGYGNPTLWLSDGWSTVAQEGWQAPLYWEKTDGRWKHYTLHGMRLVNPTEPVCHISLYEADAFAHWAGTRLPTEEEWETASSQLPTRGNFVHTEAYHPLPLSQPPANGELAQMFGDLWEWTQSPYTCYPGYKPMTGVLGEYNGKFMSNQMVLRGGSCATSQSHIRSTYRNFFPPAARWQFSGIRLARDA